MAVAAASLGGCAASPGQTDDPDDPTIWIVVSGEVAPEVEAFLGPAETARTIASTDGRTMLRLREEELGPLSGFFHDRFHRCGGFTAHSTLDKAFAALEERPVPIRRQLAPLQIGEQETVEALIPLVDPVRIRTTIMALALFTTRYYQSATGVQAATWLRDSWAELAAARPGAVAELRPHAGWAQPSVLLTIPGDELAEEVVVIGGHLDSINIAGGTRAPGADDDASGIATLTEVARLIVSQGIRLRRTIIFMGYAAEEVGLRGSDEIAEDFAARGIDVVGVLQFDMTNYDGSPHDIVLITDHTDPVQTDFLADLAGFYVPEFPVSSDDCGYACSDHASWTRAGFPSVFPFEATLSTYNPNIHTANDTLAVSGNNANHAAKFAKLGVAYALEMAEVPDPVAEPPLVRLSQVAYDVTGDDRMGEFVEFQNVGGQAADLSGWTLGDGTFSFTFPAGASVPAGGFASLARDATGFSRRYGQPADMAGLSFALSNRAGQLVLRDPSGAEIDHVGWERPGWPLNATTGKSIIRTAADDTGTPADWAVSPAADPRSGDS